MAKLVKYILIPIFFVFVMSHNASAVSQTFYLKNGVYAYGIPAASGGQGGNSINVQSGQSFNVQNNIYALPASKFWYSMAFKFKSDNSNVDLSQYTDYTYTFTYCSEFAYFSPTSNDYFRLTDYSEYPVYDYKRIEGAGGTVWDSNIWHLSQVNKCSNVILKGKNGIKQSTNAFQLGTTNNSSFTRMFGFDPASLDAVSNSYLYIISPTVVFYDNPNEADEAIQKEKQNVQNAANDSQTSGSSSQNDATSATSSLISVITSGIGAITSASASNCVINADMGNLDMGSIDLCANPVPTFMQVIGSIIAALVVLPLVIVLFNRFIAIIGSFQR